MTRSRLRRSLRGLYVFLGVTLMISLGAKAGGHIGALQGTGFDTLLKDVYEYLKDMSLLIATAGVAYITNLFQKRSNFVENLEQEWRGIVKTKSALFTFCEKQYPTVDDYIATFCRVSEALDNMRIIYRNVGETDRLIGLYPFAPLHDMRRSLMTLDPRKSSNIPPEHRKLVRDAVLQSFYALRETFLEELDLAEPDTPLLVSGAWRGKRPGFEDDAAQMQKRQRAALDRMKVPRPDIDDFLKRQYAIENAEPPAPVADVRSAPRS
jgi:hypothetical protein